MCSRMDREIRGLVALDLDTNNELDQRVFFRRSRFAALLDRYSDQLHEHVKPRDCISTPGALCSFPDTNPCRTPYHVRSTIQTGYGIFHTRPDAVLL